MRTVAETGSTNADLIAEAASGSPEGLWLRAERQSGGRGRLGRKWSSPAGNLHASTIVRFGTTSPEPATLALVAAVALHETLSAWAGERAGVMRIKWPNDLLVDGAKIAGILLERGGDAVIVGFGVNLARHPNDVGQPATSFAGLGLSPPDPDLFIHDLAAAFAHWLARWRGEGLEPVRRCWLEFAHPEGTALTYSPGDGRRVQGLFEGLETDGALRLRLSDGNLIVVHAGDVFLL